MDLPLSKRPRLDVGHAQEIRAKRSAFLSSLSRDVSPPLNSNRLDDDRKSSKSQPSKLEEHASNEAKDQDVKPLSKSFPAIHSKVARSIISSPFQLTRSQGLPAKDNVDTVGLHDILGDPLIRQAWIFNFCFDVDWTMQHFDADVRELVDVKIVHGSWRKEDGNRLQIEEHLKHWKNVHEIKAYLPDAFGTHHSKMIILFKHDDTTQVIIHTSNMLEKDWEHMTQAVWRSPALLLLSSPEDDRGCQSLGSGARFKHDLLRYLKAYGSKLKSLGEQLSKYDFSQVRAALIASVPSYQKGADPPDEAWGHLALRNTVASIKEHRGVSKSFNTPHLVCQVSSIATLPASWLDETIFRAAAPPLQTTSGTKKSSLTTSIIYPTQTDLRNAITGYATGGSIHTKTASAAQQKQVTALRPQLHRWGAQSTNPTTQAGRHLVPPHIKTYICYSTKPTAANPTPDTDWVLVTSANLSTQAWGTAPKLPKGVRDPDQAVVHIQSFEIGVLVWPELFLDQENDVGAGTRKARMVPVFGKDTPEMPQTLSSAEADEVVVGVRMPYDLPLTPYGANEMPWSPTASYSEPDSLGQVWGGWHR